MLHQYLSFKMTSLDKVCNFRSSPRQRLRMSKWKFLFFLLMLATGINGQNIGQIILLILFVKDLEEFNSWSLFWLPLLTINRAHFSASCQAQKEKALVALLLFIKSTLRKTQYSSNSSNVRTDGISTDANKPWWKLLTFENMCISWLLRLQPACPFCISPDCNWPDRRK